jgi:hypothetical protein
MMNKENEQPETPPATTSNWSWSVYIFSAMIVAGLVFWSLLASDPWGWIAPKKVTLQINGQHYEVTERKWRKALEHSLKAMSIGEQAFFTKFEKDIDNAVAKAFQLPRSQVDVAADWYYSIVGQVTRSFISAESVGNRLKDRLFPEEKWEEFNNELLETITESMSQGSQRSLNRMRNTLHHELAAYRMDTPGASSDYQIAFDWDADSMLNEILESDILDLQSGGAIVTSGLVTLGTRRLLNSIAAKRAAQRAAGRAVTVKLIAACTSTGPFAWICSIGVGVTTFAATELTIFYLDESRNREDFEAALHTDLDRIEQQFRESLKKSMVSALETEFNARHDLILETTRPVDRLFSR